MTAFAGRLLSRAKKSAMELRDAYDQITAIRTHLAATDRLRGLRAVPVAFSGLLALGAAVAQGLWIQDPLAEPADAGKLIEVGDRRANTRRRPSSA